MKEVSSIKDLKAVVMEAAALQNISIPELAQRAEISYSSIYRWVQGKTALSGESIFRVLQVLNCKVGVSF